jgi:uncharacterized protein (DUF58 family)
VRLFNHLKELWQGPQRGHVVPEQDEETNLFQARVRELQTQRLMSSQLSGDYASAFLGQGLSFAELREYHAGDEPRFIHWGATARIGKPFVKLFREERQLRLMIFLDVTPSMMETNRKVQAMELASLLISIGQKNRDLVGFAPFSSTLNELYPPANSRPHYRQVLFALQSVATCHQPTRFEDIATLVKEQIRGRSVLIFISDFEDLAIGDGFTALTRMHDVLCVHIPGTAPKHHCGLIQIADPETGGLRLLDSAESSLAYQQSIEAEESHWNSLRTLLSSGGADVVRYKTNARATIDEITHRRRGRRH